MSRQSIAFYTNPKITYEQANPLKMSLQTVVILKVYDAKIKENLDAHRSTDI